MISPAVMFIETAANTLKNMDQSDPIRSSQYHELQSFGNERAKRMGATGLSDDFMLGYTLGIETARVLLKMMPAAVQAKIEL